MSEQVQAIDHTFFKSVSHDVSNLHMYWKIYRQLFATSEQRISLLNETGSLVFYILQHLLLDEVTLAICRLTDPSEMGKRENHSLERLVSSVTDSDLLSKLQPLLESIRKLAQPFRDRRNRAIAHSDLETKMKLATDPLPGISRKMVEQMLEQIRSFMNAYDLYYFKNTTMYQEVILPLGADGDFLTEQLRRSVAFRDLEKAGQLNRELWTQGRFRDA